MFFTKKLPQIIVNEFYHRHIFEQDGPISPEDHDDQNTNANNVYDGPRLPIGCTKLAHIFQRIKHEMKLEYKYLGPIEARQRNDEFITVLKQVCFVGRKCLEECGKKRFATLEKMFTKEKKKIKSTTQTPSESIATSTTLTSESIETSTNQTRPTKSNRVVTSMFLYKSQQHQ